MMPMRKPTVLYCFSPPVMLATFVIETGLLIYTLLRYKMTPVARVISAILLCLAVFQLAEYNVCGNLSLSVQQWSRVGFVAIALLPVLSVHLVQLIAGQRNRALTIGAYTTALVWAVVFGASDWAFNGHGCDGNYVMFQIRDSVALLHGAYYYIWLLVGLVLSLYFAGHAKPKIRQTLRWQAVGYLVFLLPTALVLTLKPETTAGIPSIMCGFAVLYAIILVWLILPRTAHKNR
jgi:hypothetical protein